MLLASLFLILFNLMLYVICYMYVCRNDMKMNNCGNKYNIKLTGKSLTMKAAI